MTEKLQLIEETLEAMLVDNEKITSRAVIRRTNGVLKHPSDITRHKQRKALVDDYTNRQAKILSAIERSSKSSRTELERKISLKNAEIEQLRNEKELLIASHRAMILSTAEMGGFAIWKRFFERYEGTIQMLDKLGALPRAEIVYHPLSEKPR